MPSVEVTEARTAVGLNAFFHGTDSAPVIFSRNAEPFSIPLMAALTLLRICGKKKECISPPAEPDLNKITNLAVFAHVVALSLPSQPREDFSCTPLALTMSPVSLGDPFLPSGQEPAPCTCLDVLEYFYNQTPHLPWVTGSHSHMASLLPLPASFQGHCAFLPSDFLWQPKSTGLHSGQAGSAGKLTSTRSHTQPTSGSGWHLKIPAPMIQGARILHLFSEFSEGKGD